MNNDKTFLLSLYQTAVRVSLPENCLPSYLADLDTSNGVCVIGAGKASADMAAVVNQQLKGECYGVVVTRYGYESALDTGKIRVMTAAHPEPDENSLVAARAMIECLQNNPPETPVIFLISGGGSALLTLPAEGIDFTHTRAVNQFLLRSGATIQEINQVRKQMSQVKGGRLSAFTQSPYQTLIISDVVGDDPSLIASGPTVPDSSTPQGAMHILTRYGWPIIPEVERHLEQQIALSETNQLIPSVTETHPVHIIANATQAIAAAERYAQSLGWDTRVINDSQQGEAADVARAHAEIAKQAKANGERVLLFSGGELTVSVGDADGHGGPNQEYALAFADAIAGETGICVLACDTDGVDGSRDVAGAFADSDSAQRAEAKQLSLSDHLQRHDSFHFFEQLNDLIITGPTRTNVNDFRVIKVGY